MSIIVKVAVGIFAVLMILGSACVTIAAIFPPKEYKGDGNLPKPDDRGEPIDDGLPTLTREV